MTRSAGPEETLREIVTRVVDDGKAYAQAEINVIKRIAISKANAVWPAAAMVVAAVFLIQAALTVLAAALGIVLARWVGMAGGLAIGAVIVLVIAALLVAFAVSHLKKAFR